MKALLEIIIVTIAATIFLISLPFQMVNDGSKYSIEALRKFGEKLTV